MPSAIICLAFASMARVTDSESPATRAEIFDTLLMNPTLFNVFCFFAADSQMDSIIQQLGPAAAK
jgi:hypothetical protein